jgi:hypothetical protein
MKTHKYLLIGISLFVALVANAQVSDTQNFGTSPQWGPAGYSNIRYYYLPDVGCYYDIQLSKFIYHNGFRWVYKSNLPVQYRNYDLYSGYKVVITDYHANRPYSKFYKDKVKYSKGYDGLAQRNIGKKPCERNFTSQVSYNYQRNRRIHNNNGWRTSAKKETMKKNEEVKLISENIQKQ